ncbi:MAG: PAS domain S-box protein [Proteobacteria bacterium]|nr:PAS domain S-box protein [Pseudomonadota bacterium]MBU1648439.1 PAS domain S-box protein [Pseudomonadota bacterium]
MINVQSVQSNLYTTGTMFGKELDGIVDNVLKLRLAANNCSNCHHEPKVAQDIKELQSLTEQYNEALSFFITSTADVQRIERLQSIAADIGDTIIEKSQLMALTANDSLHKRSLEAARKVIRTKIILVGTIVLAFFVAFAIAVYLIKSISKPIYELIEATRKIKKGELGYTSSYSGTDEFRELISSFNAMSIALKKNTDEIFAHMVRNQTILQASIDGFVLFDVTGRILDSNPALSQMLGYSKEELLQKNISDIEGFGSESKLEGIWTRVKENNSMILQMEQCSKSGEMTSVEISATYAEMEDGGNFFCFIRDISERKKMEADQLKIQKLDSIGVLAGGIAHDFNNILAGILGYIDLSLIQLDQSSKIHPFLLIAKKASQRAQGLTQQLLTFSKGGAPVKQSVALEKLITESTSFVLSGSNIKAEYQIQENLLMIEGDKGQLSQVIQNITINAKQAMPDGGNLTIKVENVKIAEHDPLSLDPGDYVKTTIIDQGPGIDSKALAKIFDPYFTTKPTGNGLGLAVCHSIVMKHHGCMTVDSTVGEGTSFSIYLPALMQQNQIAGVLSGSPVQMGDGRILIMDDEVCIREVLNAMLSYLGYQADFAKDGEEAIACYAKAKQSGQSYAAVILDLTIPGGMGGKEAIVKLCEIDPAVKAIVSSGYSNDPIMANYQEYGFRAMITKPVDTDQLSRTLHEVIKGEWS